VSVRHNIFLRNLWYYALPSGQVKVGHLIPKILLGEPIVFGRGEDSKIFAMRNVCPHRGIPLSYGRLEGNEVECCYHGWKFNAAGVCTCIPSLVGHENIEPQNIRVRIYPVTETQGGIWIFFEDPLHKLDQLPPIPQLQDIPDDAPPSVLERSLFPCPIDHAVIGLMDPAHGPFVHTSWWWRSRKSMHEKAKAFGPSYLGFTMKRHRPSKNSFAYKLLGGAPETEISFQLPGIRNEHIRVGKHVVCNLTCVTPIDENQTEITHTIYTTIGWLKLFAPIVKIFARAFLGQDRSVVVRQQEGLKYEQNLLLIRDADTQARWYNQIKNEFTAAQTESRDFVNPVKDTILKWKS
jgi:phenylpropionate dioxygenase-like ring-hydroxylating dioxygenase large terminal subunit